MSIMNFVKSGKKILIDGEYYTEYEVEDWLPVTKSFIKDHFDCFAKDLPSTVKKIQLVKCLDRHKTTTAGHKILHATQWLTHFSL